MTPFASSHRPARLVPISIGALLVAFALGVVTIIGYQAAVGRFAHRPGATAATSQDPITQILTAAGFRPFKPPVAIQVAKAGSGYPSMSVDLTPAEQTQYQALQMQALKDLGITDYANDPSWASMPRADRHKVLQKLVTQADQAAASQLAGSISNDTMDQRIAANASRVAGK